MTHWEYEDHLAAQREGWDIFLAEGSAQNENGDRPYQLQALDEVDTFAEDAEAWQHIYDRAHAGSQFHQQALNYLRAESPGEYSAVMHECSPDGRELNEDFTWTS